MTTGVTWARGMGATGGGRLSRTSGGWWVKFTYHNSDSGRD